MIKVILALALVASAIAVPFPKFRSGKVPRRIVGGEEAIPHEFPFQISMQYFSTHLCGGSIYNADTVITAAHCCEVAGGTTAGFTVAAGKHNLRLTETTQQVRQLSAIIMHPGYPGATGFSDDVCVLKLSAPLEFNAAVGPIPIAPAGHTATGLSTVAGWGDLQESGTSPDTLRKVDIPIITDEACRAAYGSIPVDDSMICAGGNGDKDSCQGDSGGPFLAKDRGTGLYLAGVVSWGFGCARPGYPGVYAELSHFSDFISQHA